MLILGLLADAHYHTGKVARPPASTIDSLYVFFHPWVPSPERSEIQAAVHSYSIHARRAYCTISKPTISEDADSTSLQHLPRITKSPAQCSYRKHKPAPIFSRKHQHTTLPSLNTPPKPKTHTHSPNQHPHPFTQKPSIHPARYAHYQPTRRRQRLHRTRSRRSSRARTPKFPTFT